MPGGSAAARPGSPAWRASSARRLPSRARAAAGGVSVAAGAARRFIRVAIIVQLVLRVGRGWIVDGSGGDLRRRLLRGP